MTLGEFLADNGTMLMASVKFIEHEGVKWLKFEGTIPDAMPLAPVSSLSRGAMFPNHIKRNESDFYSPCDSRTCEEGKYKLRNGGFNICYRCQGKGYITDERQNVNRKFDLTPLGIDKIKEGETIPFE